MNKIQHPFYLPDLGEGLQEAIVQTCYVTIGEQITLNQPLMAVETAKAVVDIPAPFAAEVVAIHAQDGDCLPVGSLLLTLSIAQNHADSASTPEQTATIATSAPENQRKKQSQRPHTPETQITVHHSTSAHPIRAMPATRRLADEMGVALAQVKGSGAHGLITRQDVLDACPRASTNQQASHLGALTFQQRQMYAALQEAQQGMVQTTVFQDADIGHWAEDSAFTWRIAQALCQTLPLHPKLNSHWQPHDDKGWQPVTEINLALAVDSGQGLFMPVVKHVNQIDETTFQQKLVSYKQKAADHQFQPEDLDGGTFLLSNIGTVGGRYGTPMVMPPMVAALAVGKAYWGIQSVDENQQIKATRFLPLSLSFHHGLLTGAEATLFLQALIACLKHSCY